MSDRASRLQQAASRNALELAGVSRQFGALVALSDVSLSVAAGERRAVLGSNGAGKTTIVRILSTLLKPDALSGFWFRMVSRMMAVLPVCRSPMMSSR